MLGRVTVMDADSENDRWRCLPPHVTGSRNRCSRGTWVMDMTAFTSMLAFTAVVIVVTHSGTGTTTGSGGGSVVRAMVDMM